MFNYCIPYVQNSMYRNKYKQKTTLVSQYNNSLNNFFACGKPVKVSVN